MNQCGAKDPRRVCVEVLNHFQVLPTAVKESCPHVLLHSPEAYNGITMQHAVQLADTVLDVMCNVDLKIQNSLVVVFAITSGVF